MSFQFTHPGWLLLLVPVILWTLGLAWKSDASLVPWRRHASTGLRLLGVLLLVFGIAGIQWKKPQEGMNAFFLLDRSDSIPSSQQEQSRDWANRWSKGKRPQDKAGFLVFGSDAALETTATSVAEAEKIQAVVGGERTDLAGAIRLGTAAFPESGQKRLVLFSDGNENVGDSMAALLAAKPLGVSLDVVPLGVTRGDDVAVQKLGLPANVKKGQTFDAKIFATSDRPRDARVRLYRNDQMLGEQKVHLDTGKNLFTFPQTLPEAGFYSYQVQVEADGDTVPQNNKAAGFVNVRGDPRVLLLSSDPAQDRTLAAALRSGKLEVQLVGLDRIPATLAEMQSYDELLLSNVSAGDLGRDRMAMLQSAVRDFGIGLVVIGGDQAFGAGGYRGTALEETLPVDMELNSKKVLPKGALALVMHGMEFANGNQVAREIGVAALDALGPQDELGVFLWDGTEKALFDLQPVGTKQKLAGEIMGMNQGDLPSFQGLMTMANASLQKSSANLKHMVVFSDGDPNAPSAALMQDIVAHKITVTTVMIGGHVQPTTMVQMAEQGKGRFYDVKSAAELPQIFIKEASVILKSAIIEEPFRPQIAAGSELIRGLGSELPIVRGYVATTSRPRAETPLVSDKGDPLLAHWQYGLGRAVAYTSDARAKWGQDWIGWDRFQQFWAQTANWALRRVDTSEYNTEVSIDNGQGILSVEALDPQGNFRNFLNLQAAVVSPKGQRVNVALEQTGPGRYEAKFPTREVGAYLLNLVELRDGRATSSQVVGASVNYSPEFSAVEPNLNLLKRLAEAGGGKLLDPQIDDPFSLGRLKTFQPRDLWEALLKWFVILFVLDVAVRRVDIDREEWLKAWNRLRAALGFGDVRRAVAGQESLGALLQRRDQVRGTRPAAQAVPDERLFQPRTIPTVSPSGSPAAGSTAASAPLSAAGAAPGIPETGAEEKPGTTSRLLEAKRRARRQ